MWRVVRDVLILCGGREDDVRTGLRRIDFRSWCFATQRAARRADEIKFSERAARTAPAHARRRAIAVLSAGRGRGSLARGGRGGLGRPSRRGGLPPRGGARFPPLRRPRPAWVGGRG